MSVVKSIMKKNKMIETQWLEVYSICPVCGEPVCATSKDNAVRHGFNRYVMASTSSPKRSQEDGKPCAGSGQPVVYKRVRR